MTERKSKAGIAIVASVLISAAVTAGLIYFLTPVYFPGAYDGLVQTKTLTLSNMAFIEDSSTANYLLMDSTTMNVTKRAGTILDARFSSSGIISLDTSFTGAVTFYVALVIAGVGNRTLISHYLDNQPATNQYREVTGNLDIEYITAALPAGTYTVSLMWISISNALGNNYLQACANTLNTPRVLIVQEIAS